MMRTDNQNIGGYSHLFTSLHHYLILISGLLLFALIPMSVMSSALAVIRALSAIWVVECILPTQYKLVWKNLYMRLGVLNFYRCAAWSLEAIFTYQDLVSKIKSWVFKKDWQFKLACSVLLIVLPNDMVFLLQYLACYTMSLLVYQLSSILADKGLEPLMDRSQPFSPSRDQGKNLNLLSKTQMKLITMLLMSSLVSFPYHPVVIIFLFAPMMAPWIANTVHRSVRRSFESMFPNGVLKKDYQASLIFFALMTLLVNYKYEYNIINHVLTFYSAILIGEIGRAFYTGENQNELRQHSENIVETMYHPELIMSFWIITMCYEVTTPLFNIPHLLFITMGLSLGAISDYHTFSQWILSWWTVKVDETPDPVKRQIFKEAGAPNLQMDCRQTQELAVASDPSSSKVR